MREATTAEGPKAIEGVPTSTVGFTGLAEHGPAKPMLVTSARSFVTNFGQHREDSYLAHAVEGFFQNGGKRCYVARVQEGNAAAKAAIDSLAEIDEIAILCSPDEHVLPGAAAAMVEQCERLRTRFTILQAPRIAPKIADHYPPAGSSYAAYYYPWLTVRHPETGDTIPVPPCGHLAGIYARTDSQGGIHKAPVNRLLRGVAGLIADVNKSEQDMLSVRGINVLRNFAGRGSLVWGARTTSSDAEWKYVNVRRLFIFLEHSIHKGTQWAVFEPNNETLWAQVRQLVQGFLLGLWKRGMFVGTRPDEAFFVRCDRSTMTQDDLDNGRLVLLAGAAPLRPAEFRILRIVHSTRKR